MEQHKYTLTMLSIALLAVGGYMLYGYCTAPVSAHAGSTPSILPGAGSFIAGIVLGFVAVAQWITGSARPRPRPGIPITRAEPVVPPMARSLADMANTSSTLAGANAELPSLLPNGRAAHAIMTDVSAPGPKNIPYAKPAPPQSAAGPPQIVHAITPLPPGFDPYDKVEDSEADAFRIPTEG